MVREHLGLSAAAFGRRCGYSGNGILQAEREEYKVGEEICRRIAEAYGVSEEWLLSEEKTDETSREEAGIPVWKRGNTEEKEKRAVEQGNRVRQLYEESGLSQREFGVRIGTSTSNLQAIMKGERLLSLRYAERMEEEYGVGADWLLYGREAAKEYPCGREMISYLKHHPEVRKEIWEKMKEEQVSEPGPGD